MAKKKTHFKVQHPDGRTFNIHNDLKDTVKDLMAKGDHEGLERLMDEHHTPEAKSGIHIKESKKGTFTAAAKKRGKGVQEFASQVLAHKENYSSAMVKKANFARNAAKWKHEYGGYVQPREGAETLLDVRAADGMQVQQGDQQQQMQQLMQMVAQALQQGQDPNQVLQMLVQQGVPQDVAQQVIQMVMQQMQGQQQQQPQEQEMQQEQPAMEDGGEVEMAKSGKWIQKAVNPKHKGYCTPMTKKTCTPRRKALARTFKKHHGFHKAEDGMQMQQQQPIAQGTPEQGGQKQMEQLMAMVAQALQQGQPPQQVLQMLVQQGVPQQVAQQVIAQVMQQLQGAQQQQPQEEMQQAPQGAMGIRIRKAKLGVGIGQTTNDNSYNSLENQEFRAQQEQQNRFNQLQQVQQNVQPFLNLQGLNMGYDDMGNPMQLDAAGNMMSVRPTQNITKKGVAKGINYSQPLFNMETGSFQGSHYKKTMSPEDKEYLRRSVVQNLPWYSAQAAAAGYDKQAAKEAHNQGLIGDKDFKRMNAGYDTTIAGGIIGQTMQTGSELAGGISQLNKEARKRVNDTLVMANQMADRPVINPYRGDDSELGGGTREPMTKYGGKMAYGGKLGFIAEYGTKLPLHGTDFLSSNPNVNAEGGGNRKEGEVIADAGTRTVTNLDGEPTHEQQDSGAKKVDLKLSKGSTVIPQGLADTKIGFLQRFSHSPEVMQAILNLPDKTQVGEQGVQVGNSGSYSWAELADQFNTAPEVLGLKKLDKEEKEFQNVIRMKSKKPTKTITDLEPYIGSKQLTSIEDVTDKLNTRFAKDKLENLRSNAVKTLQQMSARRKQLQDNMAAKNDIVRNVIYPELEASIKSNEYGDNVRNDFEANNQARYGTTIAKAGNGWNDEWTKQILAHERAAGQPGGKPSTDKAYADETWIGPKATRNIEKEYVDEVRKEITNFDDLSPEIKTRLVDYKFNTGRSVSDLVKYAYGSAQGTMNDPFIVSSQATLGPLTSEELNSLMDKQNAATWLDNAKQDIYGTSPKLTKQNTFKEDFSQNYYPRTHMWDNYDFSKYPAVDNKSSTAAVTTQPVVTQPVTTQQVTQPATQTVTQPATIEDNSRYSELRNPYSEDNSITMSNFGDYFRQFQELHKEKPTLYRQEAAALNKGDKFLNPFMQSVSAFKQEKNPDGTYGKVTDDQVAELQKWYDNISPAGKGFMTKIAEKPSKMHPDGTSFFDPADPEHVERYEDAINESQKRQGAEPFFTEKNRAAKIGKQPFGAGLFGNYHMSFSPWVNQSFGGSKDRFEADPDVPIIYKQTSGAKPAVTKEEDKPTGYTNTQLKALLTPALKRKRISYDPLHPLAVAGPIASYLTPREGVPYIEDTGAKDALAMTTRQRFTDIQPQLNRLRRATLAQTRGVGMDPVKQAQQAQAYANEYEAAAQAYGEKYNRDAAIEQAYNQMQNELRMRAGASKAQALDTLAKRTAAVKGKKTVMDINALNTLADRVLRNRAKNRASALYQDMFNNVNYNNLITGIVGGKGAPLVGGATGTPLTKEQLTIQKLAEQIKDLQLKNAQLSSAGYTGGTADLSGDELASNKYGGKVKLPKKSVKRMKSVR